MLEVIHGHNHGSKVGGPRCPKQRGSKPKASKGYKKSGHGPRILLMLELCMSGQALRIFRRSSRAHTMNAFIGRLMCGRPASSRDPLLPLPLPGEPRITLALYSFPASVQHSTLVVAVFLGVTKPGALPWGGLGCTFPPHFCQRSFLKLV